MSNGRVRPCGVRSLGALWMDLYPRGRRSAVPDSQGCRRCDSIRGLAVVVVAGRDMLHRPRLQVRLAQGSFSPYVAGLSIQRVLVQ